MPKELDKDRVMRSAKQRVEFGADLLKAKFKSRYRDEVHFLSSKIPANSVIFDVGTNFGYFAKGLSSVHGRSCTLYCFEPISYNFRILKAAIASRKNVTVENLALSNTIGNLKFKIPVKNNRICSSLPHLGDEKTKNYITEDVNSTTIDDYISSKKMAPRCFMWVG